MSYSQNVVCIDCGGPAISRRGADHIRCLQCRFEVYGLKQFHRQLKLPERLDPETEADLREMADRYRAQLPIIQHDLLHFRLL